jgi:hypothetical protein
VGGLAVYPVTRTGERLRCKPAQDEQIINLGQFAIFSAAMREFRYSCMFHKTVSSAVYSGLKSRAFFL